MSSPAPIPANIRELRESILIRVSWPERFGRAGFRPQGHVPLHPKLDQFFAVQLYRIQKVPSGPKEPGKSMTYEDLPVPLSGQKSREYEGLSSDNGVVSGTLIATAQWGSLTTILATVELREGRVWIPGPDVRDTETVKFVPVPDQRWSTSHAKVDLDRAGAVLGRAAFQAERH